MLKNIKSKLLISLLVLSFGVVSAAFVKPLLAQSGDCNTYPKTTIKDSITVQGTYRIWVLAKKESATAKPFIQVDGGACKELALPAGTGWEWVSAPAGGRLTETLSPGTHDFKLSVNNGAVLMDKIMVVSDLSCIPTATDNSRQACIEQPLNFDVAGIAEGETIAGSRTISANLSNPVAGVTVNFAFDNAAPVSSPTTSPYCLIRTNTTCGAYDLSKLGEGNHTLRVTARSAAGQSVSKSIPFVVAKVSVPVPDPDPTPIPTPVKPPITNKKISLTVSGVKSGDTLKGWPVISAQASGVSKPISVTFKLGSVKLSHRSVAPYCLKITADKKCTGWDSSTFVNGSYTMYAVAEAEGFESVWITMPIKIANPAPATAVTAVAPQPSTSPIKEIVVGKDKQTVSGWVRLKIPQQYLKPGYTVWFKAGNIKVTKVPTVRFTSADIDTTQLVNGNQEITATITSPGGSEETLTSQVDVKNNPFVSFSNWVSANKMAALIIGTTVIVAGMLLIGFLVFRVLNKGPQAHVSGAVVGASPLEKTRAKRQAIFGLVAFLVLGAATFSFYRLGTSAMAAGLGFVDEVEDGIVTGSGFTQDTDHTMQRIYMRLVNSPTPITPDPVVHPPIIPVTSCAPRQMTAMGPCINHSLIPAARPGVSTSSTSPAGAPYSTGEAGAFRSRCDFSHMNFDDSVLLPNRPGEAHLHTYFGNTGARASSTSTSLRTTGNSTCSGGTFNRSAYWVPAMVDTTNGRPIRSNDPRNQYESDLEIYYKLGYQGIGYQNVRPFPNGLQLIAGNASNATSPTPGTRTTYWCESMGSKAHYNDGISIPNCGANAILVMAIDFPQCWDGRNLTSASGRSHMTYGSWAPGYPPTTVGCPSDYPVGLPHVEMRVRYYTGSTGNVNWRLSSDNYTNGPAGYSGHADYIFAWDARAFPTVVTNCYNALLDCGYSLGDRTEPTHTRFMYNWSQSLTN